MLTAYRCSAGVLSIGVGLTRSSGVVDPKPGITIIHAESRRLLRLALAGNYEPRVNARMPRVNQHEFDGSTGLDFNTGGAQQRELAGALSLGSVCRGLQRVSS